MGLYAPLALSTMKKILLLAFATGSILYGCGSDPTQLTSEEQQNFKGGGSGVRSAEASQGIADFKKRWEEKHGNQTPSQARIPGGG